MTITEITLLTLRSLEEEDTGGRWAVMERHAAKQY